MSHLAAGTAASLALAICTAGSARAQGAAASSEPNVVHQIAGAVLPLPENSRAGARVLAYHDGKLVLLREGTNPMVCLADDPDTKGFQASCYHDTLEPFMARGRSLRAQGITSHAAVDSVRRAEVNAGTLRMPAAPAMLSSIFADSTAFDPASGPPASARYLDVVYIPFATEQSTGITTRPKDSRPWLMFPGEPWAHVMISR